MTAAIVVSSVRRPKPARAEQPAKLKPAPRPQRGDVWPFPSSDPAERDRMAREHQAQQRAAIVGGQEGLL